MLSLFDIDRELAELECELADAGGEISDDMDARLDELLDAREDKVDRYIALIRSSEATAAAFAEEAKRLQGHQRAAAATADRLKARLLRSMQERQEEKLQGRLGRAQVQRSGSRPVELLVPVEALPERFRRVTVSPASADVAAALKAGDEEAAAVARFGEASTFLRIY